MLATRKQDHSAQALFEMIDFLSRLFGRKKDCIPMHDIPARASSLAAPAIQVVLDGMPSRSHFGGVPGLPEGVAWPEREGVPLGFLARLSLAELHAAHSLSWLPETGALLFFYDLEAQPWGFDPGDRDGFAVLRVADLPAPLEQADGGSGASGRSLPRRNLGFRRIEVLPSLEREPVEALELDDRESDAYSDLAEASFRGLPRHQVGGYPAPVQGDDMELECQLASHGLYCGDASGYRDPRAEALRAGATNWRLLLQFDSDDELGVMWGDCGTLYFWVEEEAAREGDFGNVWLVLQCC